MTNGIFCDKIVYACEAIAELCKGSTADSDSVCLGSNPSSAAIKKQTTDRWSVFLSPRTAASTQLLRPRRNNGFAFEQSHRGACSPVAKRRIFVRSTNILVPSKRQRRAGCVALPAQSMVCFFIAANRGFDPVFCPSGKTWVRIRAKPSGSLLTSGEAKNIRA